MTFNSFPFLIFLPIIIILYYLLPKNSRPILIILASIFFYSTFISYYTMLIVLMTIFNFFSGFFLYKNRNKFIFILLIVLNLIPLLFFKYFTFLLSVIPFYASSAYLQTFNQLNILAPLGISFFTFEFIHYLSDIYKGDKPVISFHKFALFALFFPTQLAGPIKRYQQFMPQINKVKFNIIYLTIGIKLIILGLFQKVVIADSMVKLVSSVFDTKQYSASGDIWLAAVFFAFQIFFDFAGYSNIGIGIGYCLGYIIPANFKDPYLSKNINEFWRRWHISLMEWLKDYIYIPLGGSKKGTVRRVINTFVVFLVSGLWHGAAWHFLVWGFYHGILVNITWFIEKKFKITYPKVKGIAKLITSIILIGFTFILVLIGWVFFRATSTYDALSLISKMFTYRIKFTDSIIEFIPEIIMILVTVVIYGLWRFSSQSSTLNKIMSRMYFSSVLSGIGYGILLILTLIYFVNIKVQFYYFQF